MTRAPPARPLVRWGPVALVLFWFRLGQLSEGEEGAHQGPLCAVPAVNGVVPMLLFVLQTVMAIDAVIGVESDGTSIPMALAETGLQNEGDGTPGLSVHTVVAAFWPAASVTVAIGPDGASCPTLADKRPLGPTNHAVAG